MVSAHRWVLQQFLFGFPILCIDISYIRKPTPPTHTHTHNSTTKPATGCIPPLQSVMLCVSIAWFLAQRPDPSSTPLIIVGAMVKLVCTICDKKANSQKALVHHHTKEHSIKHITVHVYSHLAGGVRHPSFHPAHRRIQRVNIASQVRPATEPH